MQDDRHFFKEQTASTISSASAVDQGLRTYMLKVYNYMMTALALTGLVAYAVSTSDTLIAAIFGTPLSWVVMLAPLGMVFFLASRINSMSVSGAQTAFWIYSALVGLSLASLFYVYTGQSITRVFLITSGTFGAMSLYGYTTRRDLTAMGSFLFMGVIGIVIASIVNLFMQSSALAFAISVLGVLIFTGLTAYDTQVIKASYVEGEQVDHAEKKAIFGALKLYLDFLNLFIMLLHLLGDRR
ncbi:Bax inhibitor-1/YccA family protein [Alphaproteobacteria bacterium]|nr:Bax inhibitor-1/YccA family protein [Alphaproteobacteria bacterium]